MSNTNKMDTSAVFEMFETINSKLDKQIADKLAETAQIDLTEVNTITERLEQTIEEVRKPVNVNHCHKIEIASNWVFISLIVMAFIILGLSYAIGEQRKTISQYRNNDLKFRYIKMQGQTNEESIYRLEQQFKYADSVRIIRNQVEKYEELIKRKVEKTERMNRNSKEAERLQKEAEALKNRK